MKLSLVRDEIFDNGQTVIRAIRGGTTARRSVVVTFAEMHANDVQKDGFAQNLLLRNGHDVVTVQKRGENWYQDLSLEAFREVVQPVTGAYERVACYGASMGAYAAIYFGGAIGAAILALSPLNSIDPRYPQMQNTPLRRSVGFAHRRIGEVPRSDAPCLIAYDPLDAWDRLYVEGEILPHFPAASILQTPFLGHPCTHALQQMGLLKGLVLEFLDSGRFSPPRIAADIRRNRKNSPAYINNLANFLQRRSRRRLAEITLGYGAARHPDWSFRTI